MANGKVRVDTSPSEQDILNRAFDPVSSSLVVTPIGAPVGGNIYQQAINSAGEASISDATGAAIAQAVYDALVRLQPLQHDVAYARDINDQMRVVVGSGTITANTQAFANNGTYAAYYATGGPNSVDAREQLEEQSLTNFNTIRQGRWVIT